MTEQEVIKFLTGYLDSVVYKEKCVEAHKLAIKALEEIQRYRSIGTIEELSQGKKYINLAKRHGTTGKAIDACAEYEAIGTPEECRAAVEKQMGKRIIHEPNAGRERDWRCPNCDSYINPYAKYCIGCGQKLKGGGVNEYGRCGKSN